MLYVVCIYNNSDIDTDGENNYVIFFFVRSIFRHTICKTCMHNYKTIHKLSNTVYRSIDLTKNFTVLYCRRVEYVNVFMYIRTA